MSHHDGTKPALKFSDRIGVTTPRLEMQREEMSDGLRNRLWNIFELSIINPYRLELSRHSNGNAVLLCRLIWDAHLKLPLNQMNPSWGEGFEEKLRTYFSNRVWHDVYNLLEFIAEQPDYELSEAFISWCNEVLEGELSAYRFVGNTLTPITDSTELDAISEAQDNATTPAQTHLHQAVAHLSDRESPDYRNAIKESMSAVESELCAMIGDPNKALGAAMSKAEQQFGIVPMFKSSVEKLYQFSNGDSGARHSLSDQSYEVTFADAKYVLVTCSAFLNYLRTLRI